MAQPFLGIVATALIVALSLGYLSLFDFPLFVGWVSFVMLALIPPQIVTAVIATNPPFAPERQPARGLVLLAATAAAGFVFADRKSTRLNSSHSQISYAVFCLK